MKPKPKTKIRRSLERADLAHAIKRQEIAKRLVECGQKSKGVRRGDGVPGLRSWHQRSNRMRQIG